MYERFTSRAKKVMQLANQEAQRFNHEYIGTEHILLGIVKEGTGVSARVLQNLNISLGQIQVEVEKIIQPGPNMITMGKLPNTLRAKKVIEYAIEGSRNMDHNYVGDEHILLGLLREKEGIAAQVLMNLGLKLEDVRKEIILLIKIEEDEDEDEKETVVKMKISWIDGSPPDVGNYYIQLKDGKIESLMWGEMQCFEGANFILRHYGPIPDPPKVLRPFRRFAATTSDGLQGIGVFDPRNESCPDIIHWECPYIIHWENEKDRTGYELIEDFQIEWIDDA